MEIQQQIGSQRNPSYKKLEEEEQQQKSKTKKICLGVGIASTISFIVLCVILYFAVLKPKDATTTIDSIAIEDLKFRFDTSLAVELNLTLAVNISVKNPNRAGFRYRDSTVLLRYRGDELVGVVPFPGRNVRADSTVGLNLTLTVMADRLLGDSRLVSDIVGGGVLPFTTDVKLSGKVKILGFVRFKVETSSLCRFDIDLYKGTIGDQECTNKFKL